MQLAVRIRGQREEPAKADERSRASRWERLFIQFFRISNGFQTSRWMHRVVDA
jgi:hypothetical protein